MTSFTTQLWQQTTPLFNAILQHPFNQELMQGSLPLTTFAYYLEQDAYYLQDFARSLASVASRAPLHCMRTFLKFAQDALIAEQELVHQYYKNSYQFQDTGQQSLATLAYTSYLLATCHSAPVEVAAASLLPCFWIYREVGLSIAQQQAENNPFSRWIDTYSNDAFSASVDEMIQLVNTLAQDVSDNTLAAMQRAFHRSSALEWHFWDGAYRLARLNPEDTRHEIISF